MTVDPIAKGVPNAPSLDRNELTRYSRVVVVIVVVIIVVVAIVVVAIAVVCDAISVALHATGVILTPNWRRYELATIVTVVVIVSVIIVVIIVVIVIIVPSPTVKFYVGGVFIRRGRG